MNNLEMWDKLKQPPSSALRVIKGGRLQGMSDINPQWRYRIMTETFGPIGFGWKYTIDKLWTEPASSEQVLAFASISVYVKIGEKWSEAIPGHGGSKLIDKEKNGLYSSDEAFKMAITDALSVALKMLGVAADVYMGLWDGAKYKDDPINGYDDLCKKIERCETMDSLQKQFSFAWATVAGDMGGRKIITAAKDKRKQELLNDAGV